MCEPQSLMASSTLGDRMLTTAQSFAPRDGGFSFAQLQLGKFLEGLKSSWLGQMSAHGWNHKVLGTGTREQKTTGKQGASFQEPTWVDFFENAC